MNTEPRTTQHGAIHALGIWLATVEYNVVKAGATGMELQLRVTNGERDLSESSIFADELELEMEDGRRCRIVPLSGSIASGTFRVRLADEPLAV